MSQTNGIPSGDTAVIETAPRTSDPKPRPRNPLEHVTPEVPRTHPIAYAALALAALALVLSLVGLRDGGDGYRRVKVNNADCIVGPDNDSGVLYCSTAAVPAP